MQPAPDTVMTLPLGRIFPASPAFPAATAHAVWPVAEAAPARTLVDVLDATASRHRSVRRDRLMRMNTVTLGRGATLGPHAIALTGTQLDDAAVAGPYSLVIRGDRLRAGTRWHGNPVAHWDSAE